MARAVNGRYAAVGEWVNENRSRIALVDISSPGALIGRGRLSSSVLGLLGMGRGTPDGTMTLRDGWLELSWNLAHSAAYFNRVKATMAALATALDARFTINPEWYLRRVVTVNGLGGCPMGRDKGEGVVDSWGQVFGCPGLYVADGSVMPGSIGANPSLTIAAIADRIAEGIITGANSE